MSQPYNGFRSQDDQEIYIYVKCEGLPLYSKDIGGGEKKNEIQSSSICY